MQQKKPFKFVFARFQDNTGWGRYTRTELHNVNAHTQTNIVVRNTTVIQAILN